MEYTVEFRNLCPHDVVIKFPDDTSVVFPECKTPARVYNDVAPILKIQNIPLLKRRGGESVNLPEPEEGVLYIVSEIVQRSFPDRIDLVCPGPTIRNEFNVIIGCTGLMLP